MVNGYFHLLYNKKNESLIHTTCCCSVAKSCPTLCDSMNHSTPGSPVLHYFLERAQIHAHWISYDIQPPPPLLPCSPLALSFPASGSLPKYWSFSFSNSPSNEYSGMISFRIDWFDLHAVQGILKRLPLQHHNSKASILQHSGFFVVRLSHPYMTTGKTIALTVL